MLCPADQKAIAVQPFLVSRLQKIATLWVLRSESRAVRAPDLSLSQASSGPMAAWTPSRLP